MSTLKAFSSTKIDAFKTQADLENLLAKRGIRASRWTHLAETKDMPGTMRFEFEYQPQQLHSVARQPLSFRIEVGYKGLAVELAKAAEFQQVYDEAIAALKKASSEAMGAISKLRHQTALAKVPMVTDFVRDLLDQGVPKIILFAHHRDVIEAFSLAFGKKAVKLVGDMDLMERDASVQRFIKDPTCHLFIGSIQAAGFGLTLTVASHVVFAELDWVPGNVTQAEDRAHRIGQQDSVLVQHLVLEDSLDSYMAKALVSKQEVIDKALDHEKAEMETDPIVPLKETPPATGNASRAGVEKEAQALTADQVDAIFEGLKALAGMHLNNRLDSVIARDFGERLRITPRQAALGRYIVRRYRALLPAEVAQAALGRARVAA